MSRYRSVWDRDDEDKERLVSLLRARYGDDAPSIHEAERNGAQEHLYQHFKADLERCSREAMDLHFLRSLVRVNKLSWKSHVHSIDWHYNKSINNPEPFHYPLPRQWDKPYSAEYRSYFMDRVERGDVPRELIAGDAVEEDDNDQGVPEHSTAVFPGEYVEAQEPLQKSRWVSDGELMGLWNAIMPENAKPTVGMAPFSSRFSGSLEIFDKTIKAYDVQVRLVKSVLDHRVGMYWANILKSDGKEEPQIVGKVLHLTVEKYQGEERDAMLRQSSFHYHFLEAFHHMDAFCRGEADFNAENPQTLDAYMRGQYKKSMVDTARALTGNWDVPSAQWF
ncbi:hypothetical protein B0T19DRAFT_433365 [Cercophora scortea]|uniref:Uncharacterized protein n=1 Tax=Cercophora scortea TaxID=314031 RepID=A0AAE0I7J8_9PEZI|nr:hypothetical protein B0T19DRAFT_433365 [Cercophora scortea]